MKCFQCRREITVKGVLLTADGDFACDSVCKGNYEKDRDRLFNETIHCDKKIATWWSEKPTQRQPSEVEK